MATVQEMMDAPPSTETSNMMAVGDTFEGNISDFDSDWIGIDLVAGTSYRFTVEGRDDPATADDDEGLADSVLQIRDSKGGVIVENDDEMPSMGDLDSALTFTPEVSGTYYIRVSAFQGNPGEVYAGDYVVRVTEVSSDITGTRFRDKLVGTSAGEKISGAAESDVLDGGGGNDRLFGGSGNDLLTGGAGADVLNGGDGEDTISYRYSVMGESITINLASGAALGGHAEGDTIGSDIENVEGAMDAENMLTGNRGPNKLIGGAWDDVLIGGRGDDDLRGRAGDDELEGDDGEDTLEGGPGADKLTGGDGDDTASYASSMMPVTVRLHANQAMGGDAEGDIFVDMVTVPYTMTNEDEEEEEFEETVPDIKNLTGSGMGDTLAGDSRDNEIRGGGGDDKLYGGPGGGDDMLMGEGGDDMVFGGRGDDELNGGSGNDTLVGGLGKDEYDGGAGNDMIFADTADLVGVAATDIDGGENPATAPSGDSDTVSFERLEDTEVTFTLGTHSTNVENIIGSEEDDNLTGDDQDNIIEGGDNGDTLDGMGQPTAADGGVGDTVSYRSSDRGVNVSLAAHATATGRHEDPSGGHASGDQISNFENIIGSAHDDNLEGNDASNILTGLAGADELEGGTGADTLEGGAGADELDGGGTTAAGSDGTTGVVDAADTVSYASSDAGVRVNLTASTASGGHADGDDLEVQSSIDHDGYTSTDNIEVSTFENITGSMHNDRLTGDYRDNTLNGGAGDDTLIGGAGVDKLIGGPGADVLNGGESRTVADDPSTPLDESMADGTSEQLDWAVYRPSMMGVTVDLSRERGTGGDAMGDTLKDIEVVWGSMGDDLFIASGTGGVDRVDRIHGDNGSDTISYQESGSGVTVNLQTDQPATFDNDPSLTDLGTAITVGTGPNGANSGEDNAAAGDFIGGIENIIGSNYDDDLTGNSAVDDPSTTDVDEERTSTLDGMGGNDELNGGVGDDTLNGGSGRDELLGNAGDDTLNGGAGDDVLNGGAGDDVFVFTADDKGASDTILEFSRATDNMDQIDLSAFDINRDELMAAITLRDTNADGTDDTIVIDLSDFGGGRIVLDTQADTGVLDADATTEGLQLSVVDDTNPDGVFIL